MKHNILTLALVANLFATANAAPLADLSGGQTGRIEFQSTTPDHRHALINGRLGPAVVVYGQLLMPAVKADAKVPAVVFSHGSEGMDARYIDFWAKQLNAAGYAAFVVDSFNPRGFKNASGAAQLTHNITGSISDSLHALKLLATHPKIDSQRIFHMGWSLGGVVVNDVAFPSFQKPILGNSATQWAGSVSFYGGCNVRRRVDHNGKNEAPLLMLLGGLDDNTPAANCVAYAKSLAAAGNNVAYKVYEGAYHDWDMNTNTYINHGVFFDCDFELKLTPGTGYGTAFDYKAMKLVTNGDEESAALSACKKVSRVAMIGNAKIRDQSLKDTLEFMEKIK
jgi:dienelactone hydrolase